MKKLFENTMVHYSFVLMSVALACGLVIGAINAVTAPIIEENRIREQIEAYERVLPGIAAFDELDIDGDPDTILTKVEGRNAQDEVIGYIYVAYATNKYGSMRIIASVALNGTILGVDFLEILQTYNVNDTRTNLSLYEGMSITDAAPIGDMISGVTGSRNTLIELMEDIAVAHERMDLAPVDPYAGWFDGTVERNNDDAFTPEGSILSRQIVTNENSDVVGYIYEITKDGESYDGERGTITIHVGVNVDLDIVGILIPEDTYGHTKGFRNQMITFATNTYVGSNVADIVTLEDADLVSGATNSSRLISEMLDELKGVLLP